MTRILIVDDEINILESLSAILRHENYDVDICSDGFSAIDFVKRNDYELVLLDIKMPKMDGIEVLEKILNINPGLVVIMISGHGTIETALESAKKGAYDFLQKPLPDVEELLLTIRNAVEFKKSKDELHRLKNELIEKNVIIGKSESINNVKNLITKYADLNLNVLITGESGTGKMLVANEIHFASKRAGKPVITINCAGLNDKNADDELFGFFDGSRLITKGKLAEAEGGTVHFDEVSNLPLEVQSKILKVIDEGKFTRRGQNSEIRIDVRFVFSTNKDLSLEISENRFREDLYHRINVLKIDIPPLRERTEDIEMLVEYFSDRVSETYNVRKKTFKKDAVEKLKTMRWAGNVRELRNLVERIMFTVDADSISADDIEIPGTKRLKELNELLNKDLSLNDFQNESEKIFLVKVLGDYNYNVSRTAEALNIQRSHLYKLINKYGIIIPSRTKS